MILKERIKNKSQIDLFKMIHFLQYLKPLSFQTKEFCRVTQNYDFFCNQKK